MNRKGNPSRALAVMLCLLMLFSRANAVEAGFTVFHGSREHAQIALTVDDCYDGARVTEVLDLCEEYGVPVTFFVIGSALKLDDQALWQRALALGCEVGNHTWSHARLPTLNSRDVKRQLGGTQEKLDKLLGFHYGMQVMRPPYGSLSEDANKMSDMWVVEAIEAAGYLHAVRWDVSQTDPALAVDDVQNGSILLYHANKKDIRCLRRLIPALLEKGFTCVTVSELLDLPEPVCDLPSPWLVEEDSE